MNKISNLFRQQLFQLLLFALGFLLLNWPLLSILIEGKLPSSFRAIFFCWTLLIIIQALLGRSLTKLSPGSPGNKNRSRE